MFYFVYSTVLAESLRNMVKEYLERDSKYSSLVSEITDCSISLQDMLLPMLRLL